MVRTFAALLAAASLMVTSVGAQSRVGDSRVDDEAMAKPTPLGGEVKPKTALRLIISGEARLSFVSRNSDVFRAALGDAVTGAQGSPLVGSTSSGSGGDNFFDPMITLDMDFQLSQGVSMFLELETPFNKLATRAGGISGANRDIEVEQAYVDWRRAFDQDLDFRIGIQDFRADFTDSGNPFFLDVSHSESPFNNPTTGTGDFGTPQSSSSGSPGVQEAVGVNARVGLGDTDLNIFHMTFNETFRKNSDDVLYGAMLQHPLGDPSDPTGKLGALVMVMQNDGSSYLWTYGGGGYTWLMDRSLKLYGEGYAQSGVYNKLGGVTVDQEDAFALYGGARFMLPGLDSLAAFIDASYWEVSGDDDGADGRNESFVSFENNNDTAVVEDGYYGLDIDSNYRAIKGKIGFSPLKSVSVEALLAWFELQNNNSDRADGATSHHDRIGTEFDVTVTYRATDNLNFRLRSGWLFDAKALGLQQDLNVTVIEARLQF